MRWMALAGILVLGCVTAARADQSYIKVQPIQVCDAAGANCATVTLDKAATQQILSQAGIAVQWAPTIQYNAPATAVTYQPGLGLVTTVQGAGGDATDQAHVLVRGYQEPPNPTPADPQLLNLFYVSAIARSDGGPVNGLGLVGSNGMVVADVSTGLGSNTGVPIDVAAHEIGHNLGLKDVDLPNPGVAVPAAELALNLMNSLSRITPPALSITTDGVNGTDHLLPAQVAIMRQPLFTVDGASAFVSTRDSRLSARCGYSSDICDQAIALPAGASTQTLQTVKLRYLPEGAAVAGSVRTFSGDASACTGSFVGQSGLASGGTELDFTFDGAGCRGGQDAELETYFETGSSTVPFSAEFDFSGGITSTALFDSTSGIADSMVNATYAISGPTMASPGFVLPVTDNLDIDYTPITTSVPEPSSLGLLGLAAMALGMSRWQRTARKLPG